MNTSDLAGSLRLYSEILGFENAGGQGIWGSTIRIQGLDPDSRAMMWWLVGRHDFFQLEFFRHEVPPPRPLRPDWRPSDCGWTRIGVAVRDFGGVLAGLARWGIDLLAPPVERRGLRRAAFRDPFVGTVVELLEEGEALPGHDLRPAGEGPAIAYVAASVTNLEAARTFYGHGLGLELLSLGPLHASDDEAGWGLAGARREGFLACAGAVLLEILRYESPVPRSRADDYRCSDQGIVNVALGSVDARPVEEALARLATLGSTPPFLVEGDGVVAGYILEPEREIELCAIPEALHPALGFTSSGPFLT
jgi:catechol 2,3-dioxygenase-like lactoylglutathione lyase family enzyme